VGVRDGFRAKGSGRAVHLDRTVNQRAVIARPATQGLGAIRGTPNAVEKGGSVVFVRPSAPKLFAAHWLGRVGWAKIADGAAAFKIRGLAVTFGRAGVGVRIANGVFSPFRAVVSEPALRAAVLRAGVATVHYIEQAGVAPGAGIVQRWVGVSVSLVEGVAGYTRRQGRYHSDGIRDIKGLG